MKIFLVCLLGYFIFVTLNELKYLGKEENTYLSAMILLIAIFQFVYFSLFGKKYSNHYSIKIYYIILSVFVILIITNIPIISYDNELFKAISVIATLILIILGYFYSISYLNHKAKTRKRIKKIIGRN